jgi:hypothetical protein
MKKRNLGILIAVAAAAIACEKAEETADVGAGPAQTYDEAAGELANDVAAGADEATDAGKKQAADAATAAEEGIKTE